MQYFTRDWTGTNGDPWPGFLLAAGSNVDEPEIVSNQGAGGATEVADRYYRVTAYPQTENHKVAVDALWANAATAGDSFKLCVRMSDNADRGYLVEFSSFEPPSTLNTPTVIFTRRRLGSDTALQTSDISGTVTGVHLNAGVTCQARVETLENGDVKITALVDTGSGLTEVASYTDTSASKITSLGTVAIGTTNTWKQSEILLDNLVCEDFEDEAPVDSDYAAGLGLIVNGYYFDEAELTARGVVDVEWRESYASGTTIQIIDNNDFHDPWLKGGEDVSVLYGGAVVAWGIVRDRTHDGTNPEGNSYALRSPKSLARGVPIKHPTNGSGTITFNRDPDNEYYEAALAGMDLKAIAEYVFDNHLEGEDGLRAKKAAPASGTAYSIPAAWASIGPEALHEFTVSGDFVQAMDQLLFYARSYGWKIDASSRQHVFDKRDTAPSVTVDAQECHGTPKFSKKPSQNRTAIILHGGKPEVVFETMSLSGGTVKAGWDQSTGSLAGADYDHRKKDKSDDQSTITSFGYDAGPGKVFVVLDTTGDFATKAGEWRRTTLIMGAGTGVEQGNTYYVYDNDDSGKLWLNAAAWQDGNPTIGGAVTVAGGDLNDPDSRNNAYNEMFRVYEITDPAKHNIALGECVQVRVSIPQLDTGNAIKPWNAQFYPGTGKIELDKPALLPIGLHNRFPSLDAGACGGGDAIGGIVDGTIGDIEVDVPIAQENVPYKRFPTTGYVGSAFAHDSAKWSGGGEYTPGVDDGVMDVLVIHDPNYQYPSIQDADYTAFADEVLAALGTLSVEAEIVIADCIDDRFFGLNKRINYEDTGKRTTGYESANLWLMESRYSYANQRTTLLCGTQGSFRGLDVETVRKVHTDNARIKAFREQLKAFQKMKDCLNEYAGLNGGQVSDSGESQICATQVSYTNQSKTKTTNVTNKFLEVKEVLEATAGILQAQKGGTFSYNDSNENLYYQNDDGAWFVWNPSTGLWEPVAGYGDAPPGVGGSSLGPWADLDDFGGWEGAQWKAIKGLAANLGKTIDIVTGEVLKPGTTNNGTNNPNSHPWVTYGPDGKTTPVTPGSDVPPTIVHGGTNGGGLLGNNEKTEDAETGTLLAMGATIPTGGASFYGETAVSALPAAGVAPAAMSDHVREIVSQTFGFDQNPVQDPAGMVWTET